ncbi:hypothetical protein MRX96_000700 [Rhipicephalus microplus]
METGSHGSPHISRLYPEILALIFSYLDVRDKGRVSQVCSAWREAAYHKSVWRGVEAKLHLRRPNPSLFPSLVRRGIRRVQVLSLKRSLRDVIQGVPNLESLNMIGCFNLTDAWLNHAFVQDVHSLNELNLSMCKQITDNSLGRIAQHLKGLERLDLGGCTDVTNTGPAPHRLGTAQPALSQPAKLSRRLGRGHRPLGRHDPPPPPSAPSG